MSHIIELNAVSHYFEAHQQRVKLFENLSFTINSRNTYAIVGPSGAGKSSLLMLLAGLESPKTGGFVYRSGQHEMQANELRQNSGFIFQQFHLLPELDALHNVALPLKLKGDKNAETRATEWLQKVGLKQRAHHKPNQLSGGEQQRVAIARAFVSQPKFVFADEPTGNLDENTAAEVMRLMFSCSKQNGTGLVVVTHSLKLAMLADIRFELSAGQLQRIDSASEQVA